jgi:hypothetical protein
LHQDDSTRFEERAYRVFAEVGKEQMIPFKEIAASAALGFFKGVLNKQRMKRLGAFPGPPEPFEKRLHVVFSGPLVEEMMYRAAPEKLFGTKLPVGFTAIPFAIDHLVSDSTARARRGLPPSSATHKALRFADVAFGGYLYERAYRSSGLLGAFACHALHNYFSSRGFRR